MLGFIFINGRARCPHRKGGTGCQPVPFGHLPNGMEGEPEGYRRFSFFIPHLRSVRQVSGRHRLVACATGDETSTRNAHVPAWDFHHETSGGHIETSNGHIHLRCAHIPSRYPHIPAWNMRLRSVNVSIHLRNARVPAHLLDTRVLFRTIDLERDKNRDG